MLVACRRGHRVRRDARVSVRVQVELALALAVPPRVIAAADSGGEAGAGEHAGDGDRGLVEQLDQLTDLAREDGECADVAAAHACDRAARPRTVGIDLQAEQQFVFFGDVSRAADQLQVADEFVRRVLERHLRLLWLRGGSCRARRRRRGGCARSS